VSHPGMCMPREDRHSSARDHRGASRKRGAGSVLRCSEAVIRCLEFVVCRTPLYYEWPCPPCLVPGPPGTLSRPLAAPRLRACSRGRRWGSRLCLVGHDSHAHG
jgi:hypothetical protein